MAKNPSTIKEVNSRVDQLAAEFHKGLSDLKSEIRTGFLSNNAPMVTDVKGDEKKLGEILAKFDKFESDINSALNAVKNDVQCLKEQVVSVEDKVKNYTLKWHYNYIMVHGLQEDEENVYDKVLKLINSKLINNNDIKSTNVKKTDINRCYRFGKKDGQKPRPLAVEFCTQWMRDIVFYNKKLLKGTKVMVTELLIEENLKLFKKVKNIMGKSAWTYRGLVYAGNKQNRILIKCEDDLNKINNIKHLSTIPNVTNE